MPRPAHSAPAPSVSGNVPTASAVAPWLGYGAMLLTLAVLTLAHPSATRLHVWPTALLAAVFWCAPVAIILSAAARSPSLRLPPWPILTGVLLLAGGAAISASASPFAPASLPRAWPTLGGCALYLIFHHAWSAPAIGTGAIRSMRIAAAVAGAGLVFVLFSLVQWSRGTWPLPWADRNTAPFGHSTYTAGAVILFLPWFVLLAWINRGARRVLWIGAIIAALVVLASTSSRGGVLALGITGLVATGVALVQAPWSRGRKLLLVLAVFAIGAVAVFTNPRLRELVLSRQWSQSARESNTQRQAMLAAGLKLGAQRPLLGWGPGTVPLTYPRVRASLDAGTENILQLHNTPAQLWATTGAIGVLALVLLTIGTFRAVIRAPRTPVVAAASASLVGYSVVALTDHQLDLPAFNVLLATALAVLTSARSDTRAAHTPSRLARISTVLPLAVALFFLVRATMTDLHARARYDAAFTALGEGRSSDYLRALDDATRIAPHDPFFQHRAAAWLLELRAATRDSAKRNALTRDAVNRLERSLETGAHQEFAHFNLGWLLLDLDRPADAALHFRAAAHNVPDKGGVYFGLGLAHHALGNEPAAIRAFALELVNDPRQLTSPAWEVPALAALLPAVRAETHRLFSELQPTSPRVATIAAWMRWWSGEAISSDTLQPGFTPQSARFAAALPTILADQPLAGSNGDIWARAYTAWHRVRTNQTSSAADAFLAVAKGDAAFAAALARRARKYANDFRAFLAAPVGNGAALARTFHRQRPGYGVLALHPAGPPLHDAYVVQENRVATDLAAGLFPPKGWLPGRFLLALLPENPR